MFDTRRPFPVRRTLLILIALSGIGSALHLELRPGNLRPDAGGLRVAATFFGAAVSPATSYEAAFVPEGTIPLLAKAGAATITTVIFAAAAASLSTLLGLILGFLASAAWWSDDPIGGVSIIRRLMQRTVRPAVFVTTRFVIALARSMHELLWAVLFLGAMGLTNLTAVMAIVIPYTGIMAKICSEIIDEAPREAAHALRAAGASPLQVFFCGLLPRALPDLCAYAIYRFECALRSSAVMGFFGIPTLGYYIHASFSNTHYREVWTYLYALLALVALADNWSGGLRRRLVS